MGYVCNWLLYTQANIVVEVIFIGPLVARLRRSYGLEERLEQECVIGQMGQLTEVEIL